MRKKWEEWEIKKLKKMVEEGHSKAEILEDFDISDEQYKYVMRDNQLKIKQKFLRKWKKWDIRKIARIKKMVEEGCSMSEIADFFGENRDVIRYQIKRNRLPVPKQKRRRFYRYDCLSKATNKNNYN